MKRLAIQRHIIDINTEPGMTEDFVDEKEITGARAKIENVLGRHMIKADVLDAPDVHSQETLGLDILRPLRRTGDAIGLLKALQFLFINLRHETTHGQRLGGAG